MKNGPGEPGLLPNTGFQPVRRDYVELLYGASLIPSKSIHDRRPQPTEHLVLGWRGVALGFISQLRLQ